MQIYNEKRNVILSLPIFLIIFSAFSFILIITLPIKIVNATPQPANDGLVLEYQNAACTVSGTIAGFNIGSSDNIKMETKIKTTSTPTSYFRIEILPKGLTTNLGTLYLPMAGGTIAINGFGGYLVGQGSQSGAITWTNGAYHNISFTKKSSTIKYYVDNTQIGSFSVAFSSYTQSQFDINIYMLGGGGLPFYIDYNMLVDYTTNQYTIQNWTSTYGFTLTGCSGSDGIQTDTSAQTTLVTNNQVSGSLLQNLDGSYNYGLPSTTILTITRPLSLTSFFASSIRTVYTGGTPNIYLYVQQSTGRTATINNITTRIAEYWSSSESTPNGGTLLSTSVTLGIYTVRTGGVSPSSTYPLELISSRSFTIQNATINKQISYNPAVNICSSCYYAIALTSNAYGMYIYQTTNSASMQSVANPLGNVNTLPNQIQSYTTSTPALYLYSQSSYDAISTTTTGSGSTTVTVTSISSTTILGIDPNASGSAQIQGLLGNGIFLFIFPIVLGGWLGMMGMFIGLVLALIFGGMIGIIPAWAIFLLGGTLVLIILKREI